MNEGTLCIMYYKRALKMNVTSRGTRQWRRKAICGLGQVSLIEPDREHNRWLTLLLLTALSYFTLLQSSWEN